MWRYPSEGRRPPSLGPERFDARLPHTTPAMSRIAPVGAFNKRGRIHPVDHTDLLLADFYPLHQRPQDGPAGVPVRRCQATTDPLGELLQVTDHQPQLRLLRLRCGL